MADTSALDTAKRESASAYRNESPIADQLVRLLGDTQGDVLEVASGTGQHAVAFSTALPKLTWWPTDIAPANLASIDTWRSEAGQGTLQAAQPLDVSSPAWTTGAPMPPLPDTAQAIVCINMVHISPWIVTEGLFAGARHRLGSGGVLFLYGPYRRQGRHTSQGNSRFDISLRVEDSRWGTRDLEAVQALGQMHQFTLAEVVDMPANNLSLIFRR
ncbi:MAG: DUF938 domain-containing protein [Alphaproteobacteria bacterium]|nr:DUF938 domain-containing protein [Alphaproteobacteria bacterium]